MFGQAPPGEALARVLLAGRGDVGVCQDAAGRDRSPREDVENQIGHRIDLSLGKISIAVLVPRIDDLDADARVVQAAASRPGGHAGMPSPRRLGNELYDRAVLLDDVMCADLRLRRAKPAYRVGLRRHAGIVKDEGIDRRLPSVGIRRSLETRHEVAVCLRRAWRTHGIDYRPSVSLWRVR